MAITNELESMKKRESAGFSHEQARAVVEVVESGIQRGFERFAEVLDQRFALLDQRFEALEQRMRAEIQEVRTEVQGVRTEMQSTRAELLKEQRDQILRFAGLVTLIVAVLGAVYRFF